MLGVRIPPPLPFPRKSGKCERGSSAGFAGATGSWGEVRKGAAGPLREQDGDMGFLTRTREFIQEVLAEFKKVNWPTREQLVNSTIIVLVVTVVVAFFLGMVDIALARVVERILR